MGKTVQRSHELAARELCVVVTRFSQQSRAILQRDNCIDLRIELFDVVEVGRHHLHARNLPRANCCSETDRIHHDKLGWTDRGDHGKHTKAGLRDANRGY
jgi:hypothetical protein